MQIQPDRSRLARASAMGRGCWTGPKSSRENIAIIRVRPEGRGSVSQNVRCGRPEKGGLIDLLLPTNYSGPQGDAPIRFDRSTIPVAADACKTFSASCRHLPPLFVR